MSDWNRNDRVASAPPASKPESRVKRLAAATLEAGLITALTFGLIAGSVFAAKGGGGTKPGGGGHGGGGTTGSGTISGPVLVDAADTVVNYGDFIRFNVATGSTTEPWVRLSCSQGGVIVAQGSEGYFDRSLDDGVFGLYSPAWTAGDADCTATLTTPTGSVLATTSFHVYA